MPQLTRRTVGRGAQVVLPAFALAAVLVFIGLVARWPVALVVVVSVVGVVMLVYLLAALGAEFDSRRSWLRYGQVAVGVLLVVASIAGAMTTYQRWVRDPQHHDTDVREVTAEASTVAGLLTSIRDGDRSAYLRQLRPHVTDDVLQALGGNTVGLVPTAPSTQEGVVTSVAVEVVNDGAATAIAVVEPVPPPPSKSIDADPNNVILFLLLARYQGRWVVANLAPLGVRSGYPS